MHRFSFLSDALGPPPFRVLCLCLRDKKSCCAIPMFFSNLKMVSGRNPFGISLLTNDFYVEIPFRLKELCLRTCAGIYYFVCNIFYLQDQKNSVCVVCEYFPRKLRILPGLVDLTVCMYTTTSIIVTPQTGVKLLTVWSNLV